MRRTLALAVIALCALSACAPFGFGGPLGGESSGSFSSVGAPIGLGGAGQALLLEAWGATSASMAMGNPTDVTPATLKAMDPNLEAVGDAPARVGVISINHVGSDGIVMSTKGKDGKAYCIAVLPDGSPKTGTADAQNATSVKACTGATWGPG
jgi:hypothetical protein